MLSLALIAILASDPVAASVPTAMGSRTTLSAMADAAPRSDVIRPVGRPAVQTCNPVIQRIDGRLEQGPVPSEEGRVKLYRLFALQVGGGCPVPVIVRDIVPEADSAIEMNRLRRH